MSTWILADTHLDHTGGKPMSIFGPIWNDHEEVLAKNWKELIADDDTVIISGDISWSNSAEDAVPDLEYLNDLPGKRKIFLKGNHDFWWSTKSKVENLFNKHGLYTLEILQNEAKFIENEEKNFILVGTRGWKLPSDADVNQKDKKVYDRELIRFQLSVDAARKMIVDRNLAEDTEIIASFHYPPLNKHGHESEMKKLIEDNGIKTVYYGHVHKQHGNDALMCFEGEKDGVSYKNIALDFIDMTPIKITD